MCALQHALVTAATSWTCFRHKKLLCNHASINKSSAPHVNGRRLYLHVSVLIDSTSKCNFFRGGGCNSVGRWGIRAKVRWRAERCYRARSGTAPRPWLVCLYMRCYMHLMYEASNHNGPSWTYRSLRGEILKGTWVEKSLLHFTSVACNCSPGGFGSA